MMDEGGEGEGVSLALGASGKGSAQDDDQALEDAADQALIDALDRMDEITNIHGENSLSLPLPVPLSLSLSDYLYAS